MRDLMRRLERLEEQVAPTVCACKSRPGWVRSMDERGEFEPDFYPEPAPIFCDVHGEVRALQIVLVGIEPRVTEHA